MERENDNNIVKDTKLKDGISTGFAELDSAFQGMRGGELLVVAGRPAIGKTRFALNIAEYAAIKTEVPCVVFSLYSSKEELVTRLIEMDSMVDSQAIRIEPLVDSDGDKLMDYIYRVGFTKMFIDDTPDITIAELCSKCRKLKQTQDIGLVIVDYLELMNGRGRSESRQQEISEISLFLKRLARELNVPVIVLCKLKSAVDSREDHKPIMSDLYGYETIEQVADVIMFICRDAYYNRDTVKPNMAEIIIAKNNNGDIGTVELSFLGGRFFDRTEMK